MALSLQFSKTFHMWHWCSPSLFKISRHICSAKLAGTWVVKAAVYLFMLGASTKEVWKIASNVCNIGSISVWQL